MPFTQANHIIRKEKVDKSPYLCYMLSAFQKHIESLGARPAGHKFLLAVSGGIDSMLMAQLFRESGYKFAIAHCNFGLRGIESDADEIFVKDWATRHNIHCHSVHFDTKKHAAKKKISIQMAARELRYHWLNETREKHEFDYIAIAHNSDDVLETFFINLLRGTGIAGLHGIAASQHNIIRPLLCFSRKEIEAYAKTTKLKWREDSSNSTDKYERNKIRHHLIPLLEDINPAARKSIHNTINNLQGVEQLYLQNIHKKLTEIKHIKNGNTLLSIPHLKKVEMPDLYIYEAIKEHGFNYAQAKEIADVLDSQSGKTFLSSTHRITKDRNNLIVEVLTKASPKKHEVNTETMQLSAATFDIDFSVESITKGFKPPASPLTACLDYSRLKFPLTMRKWTKGDKFYPLGMKKPKKVSDFLIDTKVPLPEKDNTWVLLSGNEIAWVIGHRIDERFKVRQGTKKIYLCNIEYTPSL
jgi:tRNA(Ile)-lysidine synthase